jgi:hypothetical protein
LICANPAADATVKSNPIPAKRIVMSTCLILCPQKRPVRRSFPHRIVYCRRRCQLQQTRPSFTFQA